MDSVALIALFSALFGGAGLKLVEALLNRKQKQYEVEKSLREELRAELKELKDDVSEKMVIIDKQQEDIAKLRKGYFKLASRIILAYKNEDKMNELHEDIMKYLDE